MRKKIELLSPVGDFECLKAAVQNGADAVYFGANLFSARASAKNFDIDELKLAIEYAKLRGVKTNLTLNILIKNNEFEDAFNLAKKAYEFGIDSIIVQDLGLAKILIKAFPDLAIHASTQASVYNLEGALELQKLGFKRIVLARELSYKEIEYITKNVDVEIECFIHGALCISYSGQCLASSMIGGRSGNRGKCAQCCRLPYELLENNNTIDKGYLLSPRDLCGLEFLPSLINSGVSCLKIEGRMKNPEYVATVTRIYRKYIDLAYSNEEYVISDEDKKDLMQVFNRGKFSNGHLEEKTNNNLIFKEKPNNMGLFLGTVSNFNSQKGYITLKLNESLSIGDTVSLEKENGTYTVSELMIKNKNMKNVESNKIVTIGRMKGNIKIGDKICKMSSKSLSEKALASFQNDVQNKKIGLECNVSIKKNCPISINVTSSCKNDIYKDLNISVSLNVYPIDAINKPLDKEKVVAQINKTTSTPYNFSRINVDLGENLFLPSFSSLNELRRKALEEVEKFAISNIHRKSDFTLNMLDENIKKFQGSKQIFVLLNILNLDFNYDDLKNIDNLYIPLKFFKEKNYEKLIELLTHKFNTYIYIPTVLKTDYIETFSTIIAQSVEKYDIKGFVVSNISNLELLKEYLNTDLKFIANYTFNIYNTYTELELEKLGINKFTISPELDKDSILSLCNNNSELIVYGNIPIMNMSYCLLGNSNKCYEKCSRKCLSKKVYELKDRLGMKFKIIPDNSQTVTTIYNSKTTSIKHDNFLVSSVRIDILDESIEEINNIISIVKSGKRLEGNEYTNGNLNRVI